MCATFLVDAKMWHGVDHTESFLSGSFRSVGVPSSVTSNAGLTLVEEGRVELRVTTLKAARSWHPHACHHWVYPSSHSHSHSHTHTHTHTHPTHCRAHSTHSAHHRHGTASSAQIPPRLPRIPPIPPRLFIMPPPRLLNAPKLFMLPVLFWNPPPIGGVNPFIGFEKFRLV